MCALRNYITLHIIIIIIIIRRLSPISRGYKEDDTFRRRTRRGGARFRAEPVKSASSPQQVRKSFGTRSRTCLCVPVSVPSSLPARDRHAVGDRKDSRGIRFRGRRIVYRHALATITFAHGVKSSVFVTAGDAVNETGWIHGKKPRDKESEREWETEKASATRTRTKVSLFLLFCRGRKTRPPGCRSHRKPLSRSTRFVFFAIGSGFDRSKCASWSVGWPPPRFTFFGHPPTDFQPLLKNNLTNLSPKIPYKTLIILNQFHLQTIDRSRFRAVGLIEISFDNLHEPITVPTRLPANKIRWKSKILLQDLSLINLDVFGATGARPSISSKIRVPHNDCYKMFGTIMF